MCICVAIKLAVVDYIKGEKKRVYFEEVGFDIYKISIAERPPITFRAIYYVETRKPEKFWREKLHHKNYVIGSIGNIEVFTNKILYNYFP